MSQYSTYLCYSTYMHMTCTTYRTRGPWHPSRLPRSCRPCSRPRSCRPCSRPRSRRPCSRPSNLRQCSRSVECAHSVALALYFFNTDQCAMYCVLYVFLFIFYNTVFFITQPCSTPRRGTAYRLADDAAVYAHRSWPSRPTCQSSHPSRRCTGTSIPPHSLRSSTLHHRNESCRLRKSSQSILVRQREGVAPVL